MHTQLQFPWGEEGRRNCEPIDGSPSGGGNLPKLSDPAHMPGTPISTTAVDLPSVTTLPQSDGPPLFPPLPGAVECGVFGVTEAGPIEPDEEDVASLTTEHANEMMGLLLDLAAVEDSLRTGRDPRTNKLPRTPETRARLAERLRAERSRLQDAYADALAVYTEAFGDEAAAPLDGWVRREVANTVSKLTTCAGRLIRGSGR